MVRHLHTDFLCSDAAYKRAEDFWVGLWGRVDHLARSVYEWQHPWFAPLPRDLSEGNPIFSAVSQRLRRGIRIIQCEPTERSLEIVAYPDTFGGPAYDPTSINELVISCALSDAAAETALRLMRQWVSGRSVSFSMDPTGLMLPSYDEQYESIVFDLNRVAA